MTLLAGIARRLMIRRFTRGYDTVMTAEAWSVYFVMFHPDASPVRCTCVATLAVAGGCPMACRFTRSQRAVMTAEAYRRYN